jgi:multicomponent Na+:H+ antiporter subunit G
MMAVALDIVSWVLLLTGSGFAIVGAIGLLRFPDVYARMHAAGITDTLGAGLIVGGLMVQAGFTQVTIKLGLILIFMMFTSPTSTYALANAAFSRGLKPVLGGEASDRKPDSREHEPS